MSPHPAFDNSEKARRSELSVGPLADDSYQQIFLKKSGSEAGLGKEGYVDEWEGVN